MAAVATTRAARHSGLMRTFLALTLAALVFLVGAGWWKYSSLFPRPSREVVQLTAEKRNALIRLRDERKFEPHDHPPLGYTGIATPEDGVLARAAVNDVIGSILAQEDGAVSSKMVLGFIRRGLKRVEKLETEDRDRAAEYLIEIWYLLGFRGPTGRFMNGADFEQTHGYGEPLPPGWKSPSEPRPIGPK